MIASRQISDLKPDVAEKCLRFIEKCKEAGYDVIITSTYRDNESQDALYAQGRTTPGNIVTKARGGYSFHNFRVAFDFAPLINGKIDWNNNAGFTACGHIAESIGLEWGGSWKFTDMPHCQFTGGHTLEQFRADNA